MAISSTLYYKKLIYLITRSKNYLYKANTHINTKLFRLEKTKINKHPEKLVY